MKIITYLAFTLLSIAFQFCVMDLIQDRVKLDSKSVDFNATSTKKKLNDVIKEIHQKPHALYYRTSVSKIFENSKNEKIYNNMSLLETTTELFTSTFEALYDENDTVTEESVTPSLFTTTEYDNVTDVTFYDNKNNNTVKPNYSPKKTLKVPVCNCNLMYEICDINCCCDDDCSDVQLKLFKCGASGTEHVEPSTCQPLNILNFLGSDINSLLCLVKTNLPAKRDIKSNEHNPSIVSESFRWRNKNNAQYYKRSPLRVIRNASIYFIDLPIPVSNHYCSGRKHVNFLEEQSIQCEVKLKELEFFNIVSSAENTSVISVTENTINASSLNCSTLHCTEWKMIVCDDEATCLDYDRRLHDPVCTDIVCTNLALKIDYIFNYYDSKIINATIKFHRQNVSNVPFLSQEINVKFVLANKSADQIIVFSGNPGYITGLPVIVSFAESNHSENYFNNTAMMKRYLSYPENKNGMCVLSNFTNNFILFGTNKRLKCRHYFPKVIKRGTNSCKSIQNRLIEIIGLKNLALVAPFGNPQQIKDQDWIELRRDSFETATYGESKGKHLFCYNIIKRISLIFTFADVSETVAKTNKILSAKIEATVSNVTFDVEDVSTVITMDTIFIDETKQRVYEFASGPHLNLHLPKDFFFPFPSNESFYLKCNILVLLLTFIATLLGK